MSPSNKSNIVPVRSTPIADLRLEALRSEIDGLDDEILHLIQHRLELARRVGQVKENVAAGLKLRPDREARVITRRLARAEPDARRLALAVWRELMSGGLAIQHQLEVCVWSGARRDAREAARTRFGGSADYREAATPQIALEMAMEDNKIAVLALDPDAAWWVSLPERTDLWVFEGLGRRGPKDPTALAVGRIDPPTLARGGVLYRVSTGGDSGMEGSPERVLAVSEGRRLCVARDAGSGALDRERGVVGCAPVI
jgi:chorismate mutase